VVRENASGRHYETRGPCISAQAADWFDDRAAARWLSICTRDSRREGCGGCRSAVRARLHRGSSGRFPSRDSADAMRSVDGPLEAFRSIRRQRALSAASAPGGLSAVSPARRARCYVIDRREELEARVHASVGMIRALVRSDGTSARLQWYPVRARVAVRGRGLTVRATEERTYPAMPVDFSDRGHARRPTSCGHSEHRRDSP
jgi:hypothetical protein